eukprot:gene16677-22936_t
MGHLQRSALEPVASSSSSLPFSYIGPGRAGYLRGGRHSKNNSVLVAMSPINASPTTTVAPNFRGLDSPCFTPRPDLQTRHQHLSGFESAKRCPKSARYVVPCCSSNPASREDQPKQAEPRFEEYDYMNEVPTKFELSQRPDKGKPLVRVRLSVQYRVHSRQMLCIGGSQIPMGWSFLSISRVPMTWNTGDIWTVEVELQAGQVVEYKYVILEEQDWTKIEDQEHQGCVDISYRSGNSPGEPPDVKVIEKQMAIVAWQPGPNRVMQVPTEAELLRLKLGEIVTRIPAPPDTPMSSPNVEKESSWGHLAQVGMKASASTAKPVDQRRAEIGEPLG